MFTSNLSVNEFVLAEQEESVPLRQVMGNSAYKVAYQVSGIRHATGEIKGLMRPLRDVYLCALYRMREEAQQLGAHAVIGVRLEQKRKHPHLWAPNNVIQVKATGTAVALGAGDPEQPVLSGLSGQEFYALRRTGYVPAGLVFGQSVYYQLSHGPPVSPKIPPGVAALDWERVNVNTERTDYTRAVAKARHLAMKRLETEANFRQAEGVIGITVKTQGALFAKSLLVEFMALGTAIVSHGPCRTVAGHAVPLAD